MKGQKIPQERRAKIVASLRERYAKMTPEERKATAARLNTPEIRASRHEQMLRRWEKCTGADRARACAHITNPKAQAKSHAAQRTPEFAERRSAWSKRMWARRTDEERKAMGAMLAEARRKKRMERGLPPVAVREERKRPSAVKQRKLRKRKHKAKRRIKKTVTPRKPPVMLTYKGETRSVAEWARELKMSVRLIANRRRLGWPVERIFGEPSKTRPRRYLTYRGETHTCNEWSRILGINQTTIAVRLKAGRPIEEVLSKGRIAKSPIPSPQCS